MIEPVVRAKRRQLSPVSYQTCGWDAFLLHKAYVKATLDFSSNLHLSQDNPNRIKNMGASLVHVHTAITPIQILENKTQFICEQTGKKLDTWNTNLQQTWTDPERDSDEGSCLESNLSRSKADLCCAARKVSRSFKVYHRLLRASETKNKSVLVSHTLQAVRPVCLWQIVAKHDTSVPQVVSGRTARSHDYSWWSITQNGSMVTHYSPI